MDEYKFTVTPINPLKELSELRFEFAANDDQYSLTCRLMFGKMRFERSEREFEIGVSRATLRLSLEGCETILGTSFGESVLETVSEEVGVETEASLGIDGGLTGDAAGGKANAGIAGSVSGKTTRRVSKSTVHLPVVARPGDSWEVQPKTLGESAGAMIEGTAIPSATLCSLRRRTGGNRIAVVGEVQVSQKAIHVKAKGGNALSRAMSERQNKEAIVGLILQKAIRREAAASLGDGKSSVVAISRCEVSEE